VGGRRRDCPAPRAAARPWRSSSARATSAAPSPGRGLWAAGAAATRALVHAAAQELRGEGIHVALLIVDGTIGSPKTERMTRDMAPDAVADQGEVARAAVYLAQQSPQALSHELMVTPAGDRWVP